MDHDARIALQQLKRLGMEEQVAKDIAACPPTWRRMMNNFFGSEAWVRRLLTADRRTAWRFPLLMLYGRPMSGKTIFIEALIQMLGPANCREMRSGFYLDGSEKLCIIRGDSTEVRYCAELISKHPRIPWVQELVSIDRGILGVPRLFCQGQCIAHSDQERADVVLRRLASEEEQLRRWARCS